MRRLARTVVALLVVTAAGRQSRAAEPDAAELAAILDGQIEARLKTERVSPAEPADDTEFLRRVYLDLHGVVPTADRAARFLADSHPDRRARLVDALLADPRYGEYLGDVWQGTSSRRWPTIGGPGLGALVAKELGKRDVALPNFATIGRAPPEASSAGFLGPDFRPLGVTDPVRGLDFIEPAGPQQPFDRQVELLQQLDKPFHEAYRSEAGDAHRSTIERAVRLMNSKQKQAFDLTREPDAVRAAYGRPGPAAPTKPGEKNPTGASGGFGQGCLMARRLVEAGVPFVEVTMGDGVGWDTHRDNFPRVKALSLECDTAMSALVEDLRTRGLLDTTLVVWMGEFGRSPQCGGGGRNHWAKAWSTVLIGGGIRGGQTAGQSDRDGAAVIDRPIGVTDFLATVCTILGIDYKKKNHPPGVDRPIPIVDTSKEIKVLSELL